METIKNLPKGLRYESFICDIEFDLIVLRQRAFLRHEHARYLLSSTKFDVIICYRDDWPELFERGKFAR